MIWIVMAALFALNLGFAIGWAFRARIAPPPVFTPMPVRITPPRLAVRLVRVINRISSPELAQWN